MPFGNGNAYHAIAVLICAVVAYVIGGDPSVCFLPGACS